MFVCYKFRLKGLSLTCMASSSKNKIPGRRQQIPVLHMPAIIILALVYTSLASFICHGFRWMAGSSRWTRHISLSLNVPRGRAVTLLKATPARSASQTIAFFDYFSPVRPGQLPRTMTSGSPVYKQFRKPAYAVLSMAQSHILFLGW